MARKPFCAARARLDKVLPHGTRRATDRGRGMTKVLPYGGHGRAAQFRSFGAKDGPWLCRSKIRVFVH